MKVVPQTDNVIASYDVQQLKKWELEDDELVFDFNGAMETQPQEELVLRLTGDSIRAIAEDNFMAAARDRGQLTQRAALPSFRPKQLASPKSPKAVGAGPPPALPRDPPPAQRPTQPSSQPLAKPPTTFAPSAVQKGKEEMEQVNMRVAETREPMTIVDKRGNVSDGWEVYGGSQVKPREKTEGRERRQRDKERRAQAREKAAQGRNHRLDEDKRLFLEAIEQSMKQLVTVPDESTLRQPEELTDREIMGLQKRAYKWKRENKLLKELLYTQYVISQKKH